ncbi:MAG TPA: EthD domain-containing protein [Acidimicrobiia bacterium]|nr:EthD domain-containing protein [Acidimicrobiia bacterium]
MSDTYLVFFERGDEPADVFGKRLRDTAAQLAADERARDVILLVDDGEVGAPDSATAMPSPSDAMLVVTGLPADALPPGTAVYRGSRRVVKARPRGRDGARSDGFTIICPSVRAGFLDHAAFDAHWRDNHSRVHVDSSPGTCHYEQLPVDEVLTPGAREWDGVGLLSFATADDYTERMFDGERGQTAIFEDCDRFLDLAKGETIPASEYVYKDSAAGSGR